MTVKEMGVGMDELVRAARAGDEEAFGALVSRERMRLVSTARALLGDRAEAEDAAQDALVAAWRHLPELKDPAAFRPWLLRTLVRIGLRRRKARRHAPLGDGAAAVPERSAPDHARLRALAAAVDGLPDRHRVPLSLYYLAGLSCREVAEALRTTEKAVKSRLHRAREALRGRLDHEE